MIKDIEAKCHAVIPGTLKIYQRLGNGSVKEKVMFFYTRMDSLIEQSKGRVDCKSGCNYCCHYHVMVTATEIFAMKEHLASLPEQEQMYFTKRITATAKQVSSMTPNEHIYTNVECAFLKEGKCGVYAVRPIACRGHHSVDVNACKKTFEDVNAEDIAPKVYEREVIFMAMLNAQLHANYYYKLDTTKYEMHAALAESIADSTSFTQWQNGKIAFPNVKDKMTLDEMT